MNINIQKSIGQYEELVRKTPLTEQERELHKTNVQGLNKLLQEFRQQQKRIKELEQQVKD